MNLLATVSTIIHTSMDERKEQIQAPCVLLTKYSMFIITQTIEELSKKRTRTRKTRKRKTRIFHKIFKRIFFKCCHFNILSVSFFTILRTNSLAQYSTHYSHDYFIKITRSKKCNQSRKYTSGKIVSISRNSFQYEKWYFFQRSIFWKPRQHS